MSDRVQAVALDFDGVICDSARECFAVALRSFAELRPDSPLPALGSSPDFEAPETAALYGGFLELLPLGNRAEDFGVALIALEEGIAVPDQAAYDALHQQQQPETLAGFHRRFYRERDAWRDADPGGWQALMAPYPDLPELLRRGAGRRRLAVATAKDRASVRALLGAYGIADLFPEEHVLDKESGVSKRAHLEQLRRTLELDFPAITFVDDKVNHLQDVASLGVRCVLAAWGYNGEREHGLAREAGFTVCCLEDAETTLFG